MSGMTMSEGLPPPQATHVQWYGGLPNYYRRTTHPHFNQVSGQWQQRTVWHYWDRGAWTPVEPGFSSRHLKELKR